MISPFIFILGVFVVFFVWNDFSVVVGDKEHHSISLHLMQLCYFSVFFCICFVDEIVLKVYSVFKRYKSDRSLMIRVLVCTAFAA